VATTPMPAILSLITGAGRCHGQCLDSCVLRKTTFEDPVHVGLSSDTRSGSVDQYRSKNISFQTRLRNFRNLKGLGSVHAFP
jgi:hypothetical protein